MVKLFISKPAFFCISDSWEEVHCNGKADFLPRSKATKGFLNIGYQVPYPQRIHYEKIRRTLYTLTWLNGRLFSLTN